MRQLQIVTPATALPLTLGDAKRHLGVTDDSHDLDIEGYIFAAADLIQKTTGRQLITATFRYVLPGFCSRIELPVCPLSSITSIDYYDVDGVDTEWPNTDYQIQQTLDYPATISPLPNMHWAATQAGRVDAVRITFDAGYGATHETVPYEAKTALKLLVRHWYDNPSAVLTGTISKDIEFAFKTLVASLGTGFYADA